MKKIVLYVLSFVLVLTSAIIPLSVSADTTTAPIGYSASLVTTKVPDGTKSIAKYYEDYVANGNAHLVSGDNGKYTISSADELVMLSQLTNGKYIPQGQTEALAKPADGFRYVTFYLTADIDMNDLSEGLSFEPIGYQFDISQNTNSNRAMFCGVFDGMGHTIDNLTFDDSANKATNGCESGLFGLVTYARIKNLVLGEGCHFKANSNDNQSRVGAIAGLCWGSVQLTNVCSKATIGVADTLARCAQNPGGLIGLARGGATLTNCTNAGTVYGTTI
ncbi:MAG: hypothetical protein IJZ80_03100, partial [Clostridia bacterium]|nr:hypothetical protein [Clostridia bacterium]